MSSVSTLLLVLISTASPLPSMRPAPCNRSCKAQRYRPNTSSLYPYLQRNTIYCCSGACAKALSGSETMDDRT